MPILNASSKDVHTKVFGNWHFIKAGAIKMFQEDVEHFLATERKSLGLVAISEDIMDPEFRQSEAGQKLIEDRTKEGKLNRIRHLEWLRVNETMHLKQDLEKAESKVDPLMFASDAYEPAMIELHGYQVQKVDEDKLKIERLRSLDRKIVANSNGSVNKPTKE